MWGHEHLEIDCTSTQPACLCFNISCVTQHCNQIMVMKVLWLAISLAVQQNLGPFSVQRHQFYFKELQLFEKVHST